MNKHEVQAAQPLAEGLADRRASKRFPIVTDVQYKVTRGRREPQSGSGKTVNLSSGGVLFDAPEALVPGRRIELSISWPTQLDGKCALNLVARGRITRCQGNEVAVKIAKCEFRTRASRGLMPA
jgi:hypothetical protein